jgi:hypothetical protein
MDVDAHGSDSRQNHAWIGCGPQSPAVTIESGQPHRTALICGVVSAEILAPAFAALLIGYPEPPCRIVRDRWICLVASRHGHGHFRAPDAGSSATHEYIVIAVAIGIPGYGYGSVPHQRRSRDSIHCPRKRLPRREWKTVFRSVWPRKSLPSRFSNLARRPRPVPASRWLRPHRYPSRAPN